MQRPVQASGPAAAPDPRTAGPPEPMQGPPAARAVGGNPSGPHSPAINQACSALCCTQPILLTHGGCGSVARPGRALAANRRRCRGRLPPPPHYFGSGGRATAEALPSGNHSPMQCDFQSYPHLAFHVKCMRRGTRLPRHVGAASSSRTAWHFRSGPLLLAQLSIPSASAHQRGPCTPWAASAWPAGWGNRCSPPSCLCWLLCWLQASPVH